MRRTLQKVSYSLEGRQQREKGNLWMDTLRAERGLFYYQILIIHVFFRGIIAKQMFQRLVKLNTGSLRSLSRFLRDERTIPRYRSKMKSKFTKVINT